MPGPPLQGKDMWTVENGGSLTKALVALAKKRGKGKV